MVVIGLGYLGLTHAVAMTELGHTVVGLEADPEKLKTISEGKVPFYEPHLDDALEVAISSGRLTFETSQNKNTEDADIHWICVGTPQTKGSKSANMEYVKSAAESAAKHLKDGATIAGKSTVPVGTSDILKAIIKENVKMGVTPRLAWNPEFLREGTALQDSLKPDRIVVGVEDAVSRELLQEAYRSILDEGVPFVVADLPTSELVKVAANSFLATKISFINAMAEISEASGADVVKLAEAIGYDERIGNKFLKSGIGFGGGCLPKDIRAFIARAEELGVPEAVEFLHNVDEINNRRRQKTAQLALSFFDGDVTGKKIVVLGGAFKPESDDIRDSPALDIAISLNTLGADVVVHDPKAIANINKVYPQLKTEEELSLALDGAELVMHLTEWKEYRELNPLDVAKLTANKIIIDGRNALDVRLWKAAGWKVIALGRNV